jgi:mRNA interferase MazF
VATACYVKSRAIITGTHSAERLDAADFATGGLNVVSFARPGKLFTADAGLIVRSVGALSPTAFARVLSAVVEVLQPKSP